MGSARFCISPEPIQLPKALQKKLVRRPSCPSPHPRSLHSQFSLLHLLAVPPPPFCQCILYHIPCGRHGACIYSGSRQPVPSISGCKNKPQVALLWPQTLYQQECFPRISPPTLYSGVGGTTSKEKTPYGQGLCGINLAREGVGIRKLSSLPGFLLSTETVAATQYVKL